MSTSPPSKASKRKPRSSNNIDTRRSSDSAETRLSGQQVSPKPSAFTEHDDLKLRESHNIQESDEIDKEDHIEDQEEDGDEEEDDDYPTINPDENHYNNPTSSLLPPPSFDPVFALITGPQSTETHHPSVYYVFSDDAENEREGNDVATIASLTALGADSDDENQTDPRHNDTETEERFILIDMEPSTEDLDGLAFNVKKIASLSPEWAVTSAALRHAPTLDDECPQDGTLMLQIEGIELKGLPMRNTSKGKATMSIEQQAERRASELLQDARQAGGGNIIDGMSEIYKHLNQGLVVVDNIIGNDDVEEPTEQDE